MQGIAVEPLLKVASIRFAGPAGAHADKPGRRFFDQFVFMRFGWWWRHPGMLAVKNSAGLVREALRRCPFCYNRSNIADCPGAEYPVAITKLFVSSLETLPAP